MPDNYFEIRLAIEEAPVKEGYGKLIRRAQRALDAWDWREMRRIGEAALARGPCVAWQRRIELLLSSPVFRDSVTA